MSLTVTYYYIRFQPTSFSEIYTAAQTALNNYPPETLASDTIDFNATSGTPTMQMVWLLFSKTLVGRPLTASRSGEVSEQDFPFEIHADFVPEKTKNEITESAFKERNKVLKQVTFEQFNEYKDLAFTSEPMVSLAKRQFEQGRMKCLFVLQVNQEQKKRPLLF